jgi:hypothetical protein
MEKSLTADLESSLKAFVSWSLEQSYSNPQIYANLKLLNCAWKAQKLLWELRKFSTQYPSYTNNLAKGAETRATLENTYATNSTR